MKNLIILLAIAALGYYFMSGRSSTCNTLEDVESKGEELTVAIQGILADGDINSFNAFAKHQGQMQRVLSDVNNNPNGGFDYQATCDAIDDLLDDL